MNCDAMLELMSAALDGELTAEEQAQLDRHLAQCSHCRALFDDLSAIHGACAHLDTAPPPELREQILGQLPPQDTPQKKPAAKVIFLHWQRWAAMAAAFVLISVAAWRLPQTFSGSGPAPAVKTAQVETIQDRQDAEAPATDSATGVQFTSGDVSAPAAPTPDPSALMVDTDNDEIALASVPPEGTAAPQADMESVGTKFKGYGGNASPADPGAGQDSKAAVENGANIASTQVTGAQKSMLYSSARLGGGSSLFDNQVDAADAPDVTALPTAGEANDLLLESQMTDGFALQKVDADVEVLEPCPEVAPEENVAAILLETECWLPPAPKRCGILTVEGSASLIDHEPLMVLDGFGTVYELPRAAFDSLVEELEAGGVAFTLDESNCSPTAETGLVCIVSPS